MNDPIALGQTFNEGIGSGGFSVTINNVAGYIMDPFTESPEVMIIKRKGPTGITLAKQGILVDATATATVQVPFDNQENPLWLQGGETFTDPDGTQWWVSEAPRERRSGETFK